MICSDDKAVWREKFKRLREGLASEERKRIDAGIAQLVLALPEYRAARTVLAYLSFGTEVETRSIIERAWADGKEVLLPRCVPGTRTMAWYYVDTLEGLVRSPLGIEEPAWDLESEVDPATLENMLVLVPGLTFDVLGYRLGYGGGFYDIFLSGLDSAASTTVGLCRSCQMVTHLETIEPHDCPVNTVVTEAHVYRLGLR